MKNKKIYFIVAVAVLIVSISSLSYALWSTRFTQTSTNNIETGCFDLSFESNDTGINLSNSYPISDAAGKGLEGYTFTVKNTCTIAASYNIALDLKNGSNYFPSNQIKYYVDGAQIVEANLLSNLKDSAEITAGYGSSKILFSDTVQGATSTGATDGEEKTYNLKLWIDENVTSDIGSNKTIEGKVTISAAPTKSN